MVGSCRRSSSGIGGRCALYSGKRFSRCVGSEQSKTTAPRSGMRPAKSFLNIVAKPKIAFVGSPSFVVRFDGIAKKARNTSHDPSTRVRRSPFAMGGHATRGGRGAGSPAKDWGTEERTMQRPPTDSAEAVYQIRTLQEAKALAGQLAAAHPDPDRVVIGLTELLVNAVEHGNLGITFREKADLLDRGALQAEIERRLARPDLAARRVCVTLRREAGCISTRIEDEGEGFDWRPYLEVDPERALGPNGNGIAIARGVSFDDLAYHGRGNVVVAVVRLAPDTQP